MLRCELWALRNLFRTRDGRLALLSSVIVIVGIGFGSFILANQALGKGPLINAVLSDETGGRAVALYAMTLVYALLGTMALGVSQFELELFRSPRLELILVAPVSSLRIIVSTYLRTLVSWVIFGCTVGFPPLIVICLRSPISEATLLIFPLALLCLMIPLVALQQLAKIVIARWLSGSRWKVVWSLLFILTCLGLAVFIAFGFLSGRELGEAATRWLQQQTSLPWAFQAPASLLASFAGYEQPTALVASTLLFLVVPLPVLGLSALLYRRAYEAQAVGGERSIGQQGRSWSWPATPVRSLLKRSLAEAIRERGQWAGYAFLIVIMVAILKTRGDVTPPPDSDPTPLLFFQAFGLLLAWQGVMLFISCFLFMGVVGEEQKHIELLALAPIRRASLIRAKLVTTSFPILACWLVPAVAGPALAQSSWWAGLCFVFMSIPTWLLTLALVISVGTWPALVRVQGDVPLMSSLRSIVPVVLVSVVAGGIYYIMAMSKKILRNCYHSRGLLGEWPPETAMITVFAAVLGFALVVFYGCYRIAVRNTERLLRPQ